ncbi:PAS domain-containing protein, partial [Paludibacterium yongneupense]
MTIKVKHRLAAGFAFVILVFAAAIAVALAANIELSRTVRENSAVHVPRANAANNLQDGVNLGARAARSLLLDNRPEQASYLGGKISESLEAERVAIAKLDSVQGSAESMRLQENLRSSAAAYHADMVRFQQLFQAGQREPARLLLMTTMRDEQVKYQADIDKLTSNEEQTAQQLSISNAQAAERSSFVLGISLLLGGLVAVVAGWMITRSLMRELGGEPAEAVRLMEELASGEVTIELKVAQGDEHSLFFHMRRAAQKARENIRVRNALDVATANVMIIDGQNRVAYMNTAVSTMFRDAEPDVRKEVPGFSGNELQGTPLDSVLGGRVHAGDLHQVQRVQMEVGGHTFALTLTPVFGSGGALLGSAIEWQDRTRELAEQAAQAARVAEERRIASENARIRIALDNVSTAVMIADNERNIIYINRSADSLMSRRESELRQALPGFAVRELLGGSMDRFHRNPAHQR